MSCMVIKHCVHNWLHVTTTTKLNYPPLNRGGSLIGGIMQKYIDSVIGETGRPVSGASVTVYLAGTQTLATIYSNNGVTTQANPLTTDSSGAFSFYAADGRYDIVVMKNNTSKIISDVLLEDPANASSINASTLTANSATITNLTSTVATISTATIPLLTTTTSTSTNLATSDVQTNTIGIGTATTAGNLIKVGGNAAASAFSNAMVIEPAIQSNVTNSYRGILSRPTVAASVTLPLIAHFYANPAPLGSGASVSFQMGFYVESTMSGASNNYAFYGNLAAAAGRWNIYMGGTAINYVAGRFTFGTLTDNGVDQIQSAGHISTVTAGIGFKIKEGSNAKMGVATLVAGSVVVANTSVTASSRIQLTSNADGGTPGWLRVSARTAGTSFTITSSSGTDTSTVAYLIMEPA